MRSRDLLGLVLPILAACGSTSEPAPSGLAEPLRVRFTPAQTNAVVLAPFFPGPLPIGPDGPTIPNVLNSQSAVVAGELGKALAGTVQDSATGIAFKLADLGTGFWVAPSLLADRAEPNTLQFKVALDFDKDIPQGQRQLQMSAVDSTGRHGPLREIPLYFGASQPSGAAVASLTWDSNADLDLQIVTPTGTIDAKHVSAGSFVDGGFAPGSGVLDRDSNASCVPDGKRQEDVVWSDTPTPGLYQVKVDMFSACGEAATNFVFKLYVSNELQTSLPGQLLSIDADNGVGPGLAITNVQF